MCLLSALKRPLMRQRRLAEPVDKPPPPTYHAPIMPEVGWLQGSIGRTDETVPSRSPHPSSSNYVGLCPARTDFHPRVRA